MARWLILRMCKLITDDGVIYALGCGHCNDVGVLRGKRREFYVAGLQSWRNNSDALVALTLVELAPV